MQTLLILLKRWLEEEKTHWLCQYGQDVVALRAIATATANWSWVLCYTANWSWVLLQQNCHLDLESIDSLEDILKKLRLPESGCSPDFRILITTEPHPIFWIGLLQICR